MAELPRPDAVVFDVDGVLVETEASYIEAVARTVQWLLVHDIGLADDGPAVDRATVRRWKRSGRWNDDWDLSYALYLWLAGAKGASTAARRRNAGDAEEAARRDLADLERAVRGSAGHTAESLGSGAGGIGGSAGGGAGSTADPAGGGAGSMADPAGGSGASTTGNAAGAQPLRTWQEVRGIFEEIYNGTPVATARYGVAPRVHQERGLADTERVLLEAGTLRELAGLGIDKVGIVTGRSLPDWEQVRARIPLPVETAVATMEDGRKPDVAPLRKVVRALSPRAFVAVGDTLTDLQMVLRWNESGDGRAVPGSAVMLCPAEDEPAYRAAGAGLFIRSLADLPKLLRRASPP